MVEDGFKCEAQTMFLKRMSYLNASALTTNISAPSVQLKVGS